MKHLVLVLSCLLLAACQSTSFEKPPLAAGPCDPALAGHWLSIAEPPDADGEMQIRIGADCRVEVDERKAAGLETGEPVQAYTARHGDFGYAWVDSRWGHRRFGEAHVPAEGDVVLVRYRVADGVLSIWSIEDKPVAHAIIDDVLEGEVIARDDRLHVRLTGEQPASLLDRAGLFETQAARFRRLREGETP